MKTLYQLDNSGNTKVWHIEVANCGTYSVIITRSGRLHGAEVENVTVVEGGKNIGKSNETDHYTQAVSQMETKINAKIKKGYCEDLQDVKSSSLLGSGIPAPMLAQKYCEDGSQSNSKTLAKLGIRGQEIIVQPKLDGNRCIIRVGKGKAEMFARKGDLMPVQLDHIINDLAQWVFFDEYVYLDGELFSDIISFNTLNGLIKRVTVTDEDIEQRKFIKYHLYDVILDVGYEERNEFIQKFESYNIVLVPSIKIIATEDNIKEMLEKFLEEGHEGLMIRQLHMGYENKRTWQLCKVKVFEDAEYQLIDFEEDSRHGFVGSFVMNGDDGTYTFNAGASGQSVEERTEMWLNPEKYLGRIATIKFFGISEYGVPRFPKFKGFK